MDHSSHSNSDSDNEIMDHSGQSDSDSDKEKKLRWAAAHAAASIVAAYSVMFEDSDDDDTDDKQTFRQPKELRDMYRTGLFYHLFFYRRINLYVENHLRSLKEKWKMISDVRKLSGAGWDEETKIIILDEETMKEYIEKHSKHKSFINTPIPHYEDLKIICGEDNATGEFMGTAFDEDLARDIPTINIDDEPSTEEGVDVVLPQLNRGAPLPMVINKSSIGRRSSRPSPRSKNEGIDPAKTLFIKEMKEGLEHIAGAITRQGKWLQRMADCLWQLEGFEPDDIEAVVELFAKDEVKAKSFIAMPLPIKYKKVSSMLQQMGRVSSAQVDSSGTSNSQNSLD